MYIIMQEVAFPKLISIKKASIITLVYCVGMCDLSSLLSFGVECAWG